MMVRKRVVRWSVAAAVSAGLALVVPGVPPATAAVTAATVSPAQAKPGGVFTVRGQASGCAHQPFQLRQIYSNAKGELVGKEAGLFVADGTGKFTATLTVPPDALRSNAYRPEADYRYDEIDANFQGCQGGTLVVTRLIVLPVRYDERVTASPTVPRSGSKLNVTATNCIGGVIPAFTWVVDNAGSYFMIKQNSYSQGVFQGTADLSDGRRGDLFKTGPAHPSQPAGTTDAVVQVPCAQSQGPQSVADADHVMHQTNTIDITIAPATGPITPPHNPPAEGFTGRTGTPTDAGTGVVDAAPGAPVAEPVSGSPTFVG
jgi:hypothetical protein